MTLLFWLLVSHAVCDFALQTPAMSIGKNINNKTDGPSWFYWLTAHALIYGGGIALVTGDAWIGFMVAINHWLIDHCKCNGIFDLKIDQALHIYVILLIALYFYL